MGTIRTFSEEARHIVAQRLQELTRSTAAAWGCTGEAEISKGTPPLVNDEGLEQVMAGAARTVFGEDACRTLEPVTISEDFAYYGTQVPSCMALLGVGGSAALHNAAFFPSEEVLIPGAAFLAESALRALDWANRE